jgi:predicted secreted protein
MPIPKVIVSGDTVKWSEASVGEYISPTWTRTVSLRHRTSSNTVNITGVANAGGWDFTLSATSSATLGTGSLFFQDYVSAGSERFTLGTGSIECLPSATAAGGTFDGRTQTETDLDNVRAAIRAKIAGGDVQEYTIGGRSLKKMLVADLIALETKLKADVQSERRARKMAAGLDSGRNVFVRFGRS